MVMPAEPNKDQFLKLLDLYNKGKYGDLKISCNLLLKKFPNSAKLYNIQGIAYNGLRNFDTAIVCYNKALRINPDYAEAYNNLGNTLKIKGNLKDAIDSFKKSIILKPFFCGGL